MFRWCRRTRKVFYEALAEKYADTCELTGFCDVNHSRMEYAINSLKEKYRDEKCQAILDTVKRTGRNRRVTFNYRYAPYNSKERELIMSDVIGDVK